VRVSLLLAVLASLLAYLLATGFGALGFGGAPSSQSYVLADCPVVGVPRLASVPRSQLREMRAELEHVVSFDTRIQPYEQGLVGPTVAWTDTQPGTAASLPPGRSSPGGYEMRWSMANADNVVADALVLADRRQAEEYLERASSARCRTDGAEDAAALPPGGRNLEWRNPVGVVQQAVFLARGRRVYRVAVVRGRSGPDGREQAFALVGSLACRLPDAACR
jgi:hypothetical protein